MTSIYEILGKNIRSMRKSLGWSQAQLAEKVDVSVPYITMIELAQRSASLEVIELLAIAFSVPVSALFEEDTANEVVQGSIKYKIEKLENTLEMRIAKVIKGTLGDFKKDL